MAKKLQKGEVIQLVLDFLEKMNDEMPGKFYTCDEIFNGVDAARHSVQSALTRLKGDNQVEVKTNGCRCFWYRHKISKPVDPLAAMKVPG